ncbi:ribosomal-protein-alanine N-acetyltransferase [Deinobacterium chartae]|uniref:Ribosomal-protein-alanine N-acetyltransferase n=1 Tax=Deinobacterium chartae TaxID=521158 RepID=A0A841HX54_9DEIO|nr:GNAT family N-acetyltransferase [Deinobacterium chartae]MBB6097433.1 ribosomal-protein-alanine N-acetyltransferase [Deinobacterium chartae]
MPARAELPAAVPVLTTGRLILRPFEPDDQSGLRAIYGDPEVLRHLAMYPVRSAQDAARLYRNYARSLSVGDGLRWAVTLQGEMVGCCALLSWNTETACAQLSYEFVRAGWGQGLATEAAGAVLRYGLEVLGLRQVEAWTMLENSASQRVLEKLGLRPLGVFQGPLRWRGRPCKLKLYRLTR